MQSDFEGVDHLPQQQWPAIPKIVDCRALQVDRQRGDDSINYFARSGRCLGP